MRRQRKPRSRALGRELSSRLRAPAARAADRPATRALPSNTTSAGCSRAIAVATSSGDLVGEAGWDRLDENREELAVNEVDGANEEEHPQCDVAAER